MDVFSKRCGCGAIFKLASLRARTTQCESCARKGVLVGPVAMQRGSRNNPIEVQIKPRVNGEFIPAGSRYRDIGPASWLPFARQLADHVKSVQRAPEQGTLAGIKDRAHKLIMVNKAVGGAEVTVREDTENYTVHVDINGAVSPGPEANFEWFQVAEKLRDQLTVGVGLRLRVNGHPVD